MRGRNIKNKNEPRWGRCQLLKKMGRMGRTGYKKKKKNILDWEKEKIKDRMEKG